jgi:hypothetical protein
MQDTLPADTNCPPGQTSHARVEVFRAKPAGQGAHRRSDVGVGSSTTASLASHSVYGMHVRSEVGVAGTASYAKVLLQRVRFSHCTSEVAVAFATRNWLSEQVPMGMQTVSVRGPHGLAAYCVELHTLQFPQMRSEDREQGDASNWKLKLQARTHVVHTASPKEEQAVVVPLGHCVQLTHVRSEVAVGSV